jgi:hypothetical protein
MKKKIALVAGAAAAVAGLVLLVTAWVGPSSAEAKQNFCDSLRNLSSTVAQYQGLDSRTATNEELDNAYDDITGAYDRVADDAADWANAYDNPLTEAYDDLYWEVQSLPDDYTVAEDLDAVSDGLAAFPQAFDETFDGSGCTNS